MIAYLGLPRCASSWLYDQLGGAEPKETHYLYTTPRDPMEYCKDRIFDFSTNNWSIDSDVVKSIDPVVSHYILIVRNPIDLAVSYKTVFGNNQTLDEFISTMLINKLLCYGDIIERWYNLVDPNKILIYNYENISANNQGFISDITKQLDLVTPKFISLVKTNISINKSYDTVSQENLAILQQQVDKFEKITKTRFNFTINN